VVLAPGWLLSAAVADRPAVPVAVAEAVPVELVSVGVEVTLAGVWVAAGAGAVAVGGAGVGVGGTGVAVGTPSETMMRPTIAPLASPCSFA
jgi:hypothetical protein